MRCCGDAVKTSSCCGKKRSQCSPSELVRGRTHLGKHGSSGGFMKKAASKVRSVEH